MKVTFTIDSETEEDYHRNLKCLSQASGTWEAINSFVEGVFRPKLKYQDLSPEKRKILEDIRDELIAHFEEFID